MSNYIPLEKATVSTGKALEALNLLPEKPHPTMSEDAQRQVISETVNKLEGRYLHGLLGISSLLYLLQGEDGQDERISYEETFLGIPVTLSLNAVGLWDVAYTLPGEQGERVSYESVSELYDVALELAKGHISRVFLEVCL